MDDTDDLPSRRRFLGTAAATGLFGRFSVLPTGDDFVSTTGPDRPTSRTESESTADRLGVVHVDGRYDFTGDDYLNEGAAQIEALGTNVIKVWFRFLAEKYPFDADWADFESLVEVARHPHVRDLFERSFETYVLTVSSFVAGDYNLYFREGVDDEQYDREVAAVEAFARHLLTEYDGTGKTFVCQHWEGDWAVLGSFDESEEPSDRALRGLTRWLRARQEGIRRARRAVDSDVTVLGATEVNLVEGARRGEDRVTNRVLPAVDCDLVSVSLWDSLEPLAYETDPRAIAAGVRDTLDYVAEHAPDTTEYAAAALGGRPNVYVGELGWPLVKNGPTEAMRVVRVATEAALEWGAPYVCYWQVFDNEPTAEFAGRPTREDLSGLYLVRPDGTKAPTWDYLSRLLRTESGTPSPTAPPYDPISFSFDPVVPEKEVNPAVDASRGRNLAMACSALELRREGDPQWSFDVGRPGAEPLIGSGVWRPESNGSTTWRWFGDESGDARLYLNRAVLASVDELRFRASPVVERVGATVAVGDETRSGPDERVIGTVDVVDEGWRHPWYSLSLDWE